VSTTTFTVRLERVFQGPLDLLLHLVREQEVEIHEVEISRVITGYLDHLAAMRDLDIEVAGDFLVMAATLMSIKSRSLLPRESVELEDDLDPKDELIQRLIEYRRFREASDRLGERYELRALQHARGATPDVDEPAEPQLDLGEVSAWDLLAAFSRLVRETLANRPHKVRADTRPLRYYVAEMAHRVRANPSMSLREIILGLDEEPSRESLIGSFCALLELCKLGIVRVVQSAHEGEIGIELVTAHREDMDAVIDSSVFDDENPPAEPSAPEPAQAEEGRPKRAKKEPLNAAMSATEASGDAFSADEE
jgi:segregation and condensation protein A